MPDTRKLQLRTVYLRLTDGTSASLERAWNVARIIVVLVAVAATYATFGGFAGTVAILSGAFLVVAYSLFFVLLLRRGHARAVFLLGFALDNLVLVSAWWLTVKEFRPTGTENDLWLILMPITILGVARTGSRLGLLYVGIMVGVLAGMTLGFESINSYATSQLPVRMAFLGLVGTLSTWLVSELNLERESAQELQIEAETLAEISAIVGSSLDLVDVYSRFSPLVRTLLPYDVLVLAGINDDETELNVLGLDSPGIVELTSSAVAQLSINASMAECLCRRETRISSTEQCDHFSSLQMPDGSTPFAGMESLIVSPVVLGDRIIGTFFACAADPKAFDLEHVRIFARISEIVGASMTNQQLYSQTVQLAQEREARLELDATNRKLQDDNEARTVFLSAVSHELRTPLTSIIAFNDLLLKNKNGDLNEKEINYLEIVRRNGKHLATLVDDLLDISHLGSSRVKLSPEIFDASEAVEQIVASIGPVLGVKNQRLVQSSPAERQEIVADRQRFSQITANILSNASKYSPEKSEIELSWSISDGMFEMSVRDHGSGISDQDKHHLFQPFFRANEHRTENIPGTGLGLVIAKTLLTAHGGGISLTSSQDDGDGRGTEVRFWFPADGSGISSEVKPEKAA